MAVPVNIEAMLPAYGHMRHAGESAYYRRAGIKMLYKYIWLISRHYISQNTSSYSRYHTYEDEKEHAVSGVEGIGCVYADYRKNSQSMESMISMIMSYHFPPNIEYFLAMIKTSMDTAMAIVA